MSEGSKASPCSARIEDHPAFKHPLVRTREMCKGSVKASYNAIVLALNNIYETTHEPEALGISKALCKKSTVAAMFLLDYTLPQVAKLSKTMQAENLDLTAIADHVDAALHILDDVMLPAAN